MYKDPDKQREAQRNWVRQKRAEQGSTKQRPARLAPIPIPCEIKPKLCKHCGNMLSHAVIECCNDCALKQPTRVRPAQDGHILASRPALEFTGVMTAFEREHYRPASELKSGKYNPVSKPGDSHYGQA